MTRDELIKTAIKTVIQYAEEQGVKLRRIDFKESKWIFVPDGAINYYTLPFGKDEEVNTVCVKISYHGRWEKQLKMRKSVSLTISMPDWKKTAYLSLLLQKSWKSLRLVELREAMTKR